MTTTPTRTHAPEVKVRGVKMTASTLEHLTSVHVDRALGLIGRATLRFLDPGFGLSSGGSFGLGESLEVRQVDNHSVLFTGTITGVSLEQSAHENPELVVVADDAGIKLATRTVTRSYATMKYSEVIHRMAQEAGLHPRVSTSSQTFEYLLQAGTDLAYLNWMSERSGMVWYVDDQTLVWQRADTENGSVALSLGADLHSFSVRANGRRPKEVTVTGWDGQQNQSVVGNSTRRQAAESDFVQKYRNSSDANSTLAVADRAPRDQQEAQDVADSLLGEANSAAVEARGTCAVNGAVSLGVAVRVADAGPASGKYLVSRVQHVYNRAGFVTHFTAGPHRPSGLVDVLGPPAEPAGGVMHGVVIGVVTNSNDDTDGLGRVKVKYPTVDGEVESSWARVVTVGGGKERGLAFIPEVKDEVLVAFENGDTGRPVVLGGLFSETNGLPAGESAASGSAVDYRRIASRTGHLIELADGTSSETQHILLKHGTGEHSIRLGKDRLDIAVDKVPVKITNGRATLEMTASGDIKLEGMNITLKAKSKVSIEAGTEIAIAAETKVGLEGQITEVKGKATATVEGKGQLALKGAMVMIN